MLRLGVLPVQIKLQMQNKGLDPDLLDNPDGPAPGGVDSEPSNPPPPPSSASKEDESSDDSDSDTDSE
jgi:hypothetical protein